MSQADREKWNERYQEGSYARRRHPSALLAEWLPRLARRDGEPRALDVACGAGRNALYLARDGWRVDALDISEVALAELSATAHAERLPITSLEVDLEEDLGGTLIDAQYDLALMIRYTDLSLLETLARALKEGGYLIVEEHLATNEDVIGPQDPRFRVAAGALREAAAGLEIIAYREGIIADPDGRRAALAQLVGRKPPQGT